MSLVYPPSSIFRIIGFVVGLSEITFVGIVDLEEQSGQTRGAALADYMVNRNAIELFRSEFQGGETGIEYSVVDSELQPFTRFVGRGTLTVGQSAEQH